MTSVLDAKDPDSTRRYGWELAAALADGATITTATIPETTGGLTVAAPVLSDTTVHTLISGGTVGANATATLRYSTSDGETDVDVTVVIPIRPG